MLAEFVMGGFARLIRTFTTHDTKLRTVVPDYVATIPFEQGAREIVAWHDEDPVRHTVDERLNTIVDRLLDLAR